MSKLNLKDLSAIMRKIDICMLTTMTEEGTHASRPMSNNREVDYDGDSYFFSSDTTSAVRDIIANPQVNLSYIGHHSFINHSSVYISVEGKGELIHNRDAFKKHWVPDLDVWFAQGVETPGLVLIHVKASRIHYWDGMENGIITNTGWQADLKQAI